MNFAARPACQLVPQATMRTCWNSRNCFSVMCHFVEEDFSSVLRDAAEQGVAHGARLLEDFLLHEVLVAALFRHDGVPGDVVRRALDGTAVVIHHMHAFGGEHGDVAIGEEKHLASVLEQGGDVAGDEIFSIAEANHRRRAEARGDDFLRIFRGEENQRVDAAQFLQGAAHRFFKRNAALRILFHEVRHDLRVGFGDELVAFLLQLFFQLEVVLDDSVVDDDDLAGAVAMRMGIFFGGAAVRGPARVADAVGAFERRLGDDFFEIAKLARSAADFQLAVSGRRRRCPRNRSRGIRACADLQ